MYPSFECFFCSLCAVQMFYDPMIAKLIVHGPDRSEALLKLQQALNNFHVAYGVLVCMFCPPSWRLAALCAHWEALPSSFAFGCCNCGLPECRYSGCPTMWNSSSLVSSTAHLPRVVWTPTSSRWLETALLLYPSMCISCALITYCLAPASMLHRNILKTYFLAPSRTLRC